VRTESSCRGATNAGLHLLVVARYLWDVRSAWNHQYGRHLGTSLALAGLAIGCSSSSSGVPADVSGRYSVSVTDTKNDCNYGNWTIGQSSQNIEFDVTQTDSSASGQVKGLASLYVAALGIGTLNGSVSGNSATLSAVGTTSVKQGSCAYFVKMTANFTLTGNTINGTIDYSNQTNGDASCGALNTCVSEQSLSGSRPPK